MSDIETFVRQYKAGALNRRDFFKRIGPDSKTRGLVAYSSG
jgi:hypothetical protein